MWGGCISKWTIHLGVWVESKERKIEESTWEIHWTSFFMYTLCCIYTYYIYSAWSKHQICLCRTLFKLIGWVKIFRDFRIFFLFIKLVLYLKCEIFIYQIIPFINFSTLFNLKFTINIFYKLPKDTCGAKWPPDLLIASFFVYTYI